LPFLARRTCSVAARSNSTCDHSRSHRVSGLASAATCAGGRLFRLASREPSRWKLRGNRRRAFRVPMCLWAVAYSGVPGAPASGAAGFSSFAARARIASFGTRFVLQLFRRDSWGATTNAKRSHDPIRNRPQRFDFSDGVMFFGTNISSFGAAPLGGGLNGSTRRTTTDFATPADQSRSGGGILERGARHL